MKLNKYLLYKLPVDVIINNILPYTYSPQPKKLLNDVRSFLLDLSNLENSYSYYYNYDVLMFDLICFCNRSITPSYNMHKSFGELLRRNFQLKDCDYSTLNNFVFIVFHRNVIINPVRKIRFLWGILKPRERKIFMNKYLLKNIIV